MKFMFNSLAKPFFGFSFSSFPRQILGASSTHVFCNQQGRVILFNDGYKQIAQLFNRFSNELDKGVIWADQLWRSMAHHYNPETGRGVWFWPNSAQKCSAYLKKAFMFWRQGKHTKAMFFIGAATHLVQDACVPHHAYCQMFDGHLDYERWVKERKHYYKINSGGLYNLGHTPEEWIRANARVARKYYDYVKSPGSDEFYHQATVLLLLLTQRSTAGFFHFCLRKFGLAKIS